MNNLQILKNDDLVTITSLEVAEMVDKPHNELLKDIRRYVSQLGEGKIPHTDFFTDSTYLSEQKKELPCYLVTKKGCEFISNKLTGVKGAMFTARYINRFHDMEEIIKQPKSPMELLRLEFEALGELTQKVDKVDKDLQDFKMDLPLLGLEMDRITNTVHIKGVKCLGGKESNAYADKSLRGKVYSDIYSQLKREFGLSSYKAIKRSQCNLAISIVDKYELPLALKEEIHDCNAQIKL